MAFRPLELPFRKILLREYFRRGENFPFGKFSLGNISEAERISLSEIFPKDIRQSAADSRQPTSRFNVSMFQRFNVSTFQPSTVGSQQAGIRDGRIVKPGRGGVPPPRAPPDCGLLRVLDGRTRGVLFMVTILAFEPGLFKVIYGYLGVFVIKNPKNNQFSKKYF